MACRLSRAIIFPSLFLSLPPWSHSLPPWFLPFLPWFLDCHLWWICQCQPLQESHFFCLLLSCPKASIMSSHPVRKIQPTAKLTSDNAGELLLTSHRRAIVSAAASAAPSVPSSPVSEHPGSTAPTDLTCNRHLTPLVIPHSSNLMLWPIYLWSTTMPILLVLKIIRRLTNPRSRRQLPHLVSWQRGLNTTCRSSRLTIPNIHNSNGWTRQTQQQTSRSSSCPCLACQVKTSCACFASYASKWSFFSFCLAYLVSFHRQGIGCPKQEKILTCEHTTLRCHAAAMHAVCLLFLIVKPSHFSTLASLQEVVWPK